MSDKFFFKGRKTPKPKHESFGYNTNRQKRLGSSERPFELTVATQGRADELTAAITDAGLNVNITLDANSEENILEWTQYQQKPTAVKATKLPGRNEPCHCGSGKKFKTCCS